jgi:hypothetical protein
MPSKPPGCRSRGCRRELQTGQTIRTYRERATRAGAQGAGGRGNSLNLHERVIRELAALDPRNGVSIFSADLKLLAERPQAPDGGYYLVVLDADG